MNFDQFWKKYQNLQPNEDFTFCPILRFWTFFSSRVWQIILFELWFFFKKNSNFRILNHNIPFYKGITQTNMSHSRWSWTKFVIFYRKIFSQKNVNFHFLFSVIFIFYWSNSQINEYRNVFSIRVFGQKKNFFRPFCWIKIKKKTQDFFFIKVNT